MNITAFVTVQLPEKFEFSDNLNCKLLQKQCLSCASGPRFSETETPSVL